MLKQLKKASALFLATALVLASVPAMKASATDNFSPTSASVKSAACSVSYGTTPSASNIDLTLESNGTTKTQKVSEWGATVTDGLAGLKTDAGTYTASLTVTYSGKTYSVPFSYTVKKAPASANNFKLSASSASLNKGGTYTIKYSNNKGKVTFASSAASVAAVNKTTGVITAKKNGTAVITATDAGGNNYESTPKTFKVTVKNKAAVAQVVTLSPATCSVKQGGSATIKISGIKTSTPTAKSSNSSVARVKSVSKSKIVVTGVKAGKSATITVSVPGNASYKATTAKISVTVAAKNAKSQSIKVSPTKVTLTKKSKTANLSVKGNKTKLSYVSSNKKVAKVSSKGKITRVGKGSCTITVTAKGNKNYLQAVKTVKVTVKN